MGAGPFDAIYNGWAEKHATFKRGGYGRIKKWFNKNINSKNLKTTYRTDNEGPVYLEESWGRNKKVLDFDRI